MSSVVPVQYSLTPPRAAMFSAIAAIAHHFRASLAREQQSESDKADDGDTESTTGLRGLTTDGRLPKFKADTFWRPFSRESSSTCSEAASDSGISTPRPSTPVERAYPQPFNLDYAPYEMILEAQAKIAENQGSKDIGWRTTVIDTMVEFRLLNDFEAWAYKAELDACEHGSLKEVDFFADLCENLTQDMHEVYADYGVNNRRHGKNHAAKRRLQEEVLRLVVKEIDGSPVGLTGGYLDGHC